MNRVEFEITKKDIENKIQCKFNANSNYQLYNCIRNIVLKKKKIDNLKLENKSFEVRINDSSSKEKWNEKSSCSNEHDRKITLKKGSCSSC